MKDWNKVRLRDPILFYTEENWSQRNPTELSITVTVRADYTGKPLKLKTTKWPMPVSTKNCSSDGEVLIQIGKFFDETDVIVGFKF